MIRAVLLQRCPKCRRGRVFRRFVSMNEFCPVCGRRFEREPGYFTGAMYASYGLGFLIVAPVWIAMLVSGASVGAIIAVAVATLAITGPLMFRYSRVLWMHFDVFFNGPGDDDAPPANGNTEHLQP